MRTARESLGIEARERGDVSETRMAAWLARNQERYAEAKRRQSRPFRARRYVTRKPQEPMGYPYEYTGTMSLSAMYSLVCDALKKRPGESVIQAARRAVWDVPHGPHWRISVLFAAAPEEGTSAAWARFHRAAKAIVRINRRLGQ